MTGLVPAIFSCILPLKSYTKRRYIRKIGIVLSMRAWLGGLRLSVDALLDKLFKGWPYVRNEG